jgi:hypothetical protein
MHILEQYALNCGLKIGKPYIYEKYFPLPCEKYITLNSFSNFNSQKYSYWQEVVDLLAPILLKENIRILQIGQKEDNSYNNCFNLLGQTNFNQMAYIINNSILHFGVDNFSNQVASLFNKKIVSLYSNVYASQSKPYWSNKENIKLIQANLNNKKPSYAPEENPKTIDSIKPEEIVNSILDLLNIENKNTYETVFIGDRYGQTLIEGVPSIILPQNIFTNIPLNIRFDYIDEIIENDYICTLNNLNIRNCTIVTDKPLEIEKLSQLKNKITSIFYDITFNDVNFDFVNKAKFLGIKLDFIFNKSKNKNEDILNDKKLQLVDYPELITTIEYKDKPKDLIVSSKAYKSKRILFANNKTYLSRAAFIEDKPVSTLESQNINEISNLDLLIEEDGDFCLFYK